jgi:hypothetical protein
LRENVKGERLRERVRDRDLLKTDERTKKERSRE